MKTIIYKQFIYSLLFLTAFLLPVACDDWNEPEIVDIDINSAKEPGTMGALYAGITYLQTK